MAGTDFVPSSIASAVRELYSPKSISLNGLILPVTFEKTILNANPNAGSSSPAGPGQMVFLFEASNTNEMVLNMKNM
jgi:hypothetical protein